MKLSNDKIKKIIRKLGYIPEDGVSDIYFKQYTNHENYIIRINFNNEKIEYRNVDVDEDDGIKLGDNSTSNFENSENFVVLECINRLLEKGYKPKHLTLEKKYPLGHNLKGKLDIIVHDYEEKAFLMIECKTWGAEFQKECKKMLRDGGQLFSYYVKDKAVKYMCLYTSRLENNNIEYKNNIVPVDEAWLELTNDKEIHDHWNKNFKDNGIFEEWAKSYDIEIKALTKGRLLTLTKEDSGRIFNQFAEILRHNVVSDKPNAFNKILNMFICKIEDEDKKDSDQLGFQWLENDTSESLQGRLNDLYKKGMHRFLDIDVTDYSDQDIDDQLANITDKGTLNAIRDMIIKLRLQKNPEFAFIEVYDDNSFKMNARVVREIVELLQPYQFRYTHKQQFLGDFFELLLNTSIKQEAGQYFTPVPITRYIISSFPIKEFIMNKIAKDSSNVLPTAIDYACGSGHFLTEYMDQVQNIIENIDVISARPSARKKINIWRGEDAKFDWAKEFVYGIEADYRLVKTTKVSSFLNGDGEANIIRANGLDHFLNSKEFKGKLKEIIKENSQDNGQFDILIANPPYSVNAFKSTVKYGEKSFELFDRLTDSSSEIECLFLERAKQLLKIGGWAGIILPNTILSNLGIYTSAREILLKYFKIIGITQLGSNTFMATGTSTVALFLERRPNNDHKLIMNAIDSFFDKPKDATVLGIEKVFSKYISEVYEEVDFEDYLSFLNKKPNDNFIKQEIYTNYREWFEGLTEIKNKKNSKTFKNKTVIEQEKEINKLFYLKTFAIEKEKMLYFLLSYSQETVIVKVGEKQAEKNFLGYEFSKRRGHEGIKMLSTGTKLYDEENYLNLEKANSYIYNAYLGNSIVIDKSLEKNISILKTSNLISFNEVVFEKIIGQSDKKKISYPMYWYKYPMNPLSSIADIEKGTSITRAKTVEGNIPVVAGGKQYSCLHNEANRSANIITVSASGANAGYLNYWHTPIFASDCNTIKSKDEQKYLTKLIYELLLQISDDIYLLQKGQAQPHVYGEDLSQIKMPIIPIDIQKKIISEIEALEIDINKNLQKIGEYKKLLFNPEYFNYSTERIYKIKTMLKRGKSAKYGTSTTQIIKSGQARGFTEFDFSQKYYVSESFVSDERNLEIGDILINSTGVGTAGRVTLFNIMGDFVVDSHVTILRLNDSIAIPKYVLYAFANIGFKNIEKLAKGQSGQIELSLSTINNIRIPLPNVNRQKEIVREIEKIEDIINQLEDKILNISKKKKEIFNKYF